MSPGAAGVSRLRLEFGFAFFAFLPENGGSRRQEAQTSSFRPRLNDHAQFTS
jgi:hypothetical protein